MKMLVSLSICMRFLEGERVLCLYIFVYVNMPVCQLFKWQHLYMQICFCQTFVYMRSSNCFENWGLCSFQSSLFSPSSFIYIDENETFWKLQRKAASRAKWKKQRWSFWSVRKQIILLSRIREIGKVELR